MKQYKKGLVILLVLALLVGSCGCSGVSPEQEKITEPQATAPTVDPVKEAFKANPAGFVEFSRSIEPREWYVSIEEILKYESRYSDCNGTWYRDRLSGEDLVIYNSYLYALENQFIWFTVYVEDSGKDFSYIREMLSLDSPFLEQNHSHYEHTFKNPINYVGKSISVNMDQFTGKRWEMKMEALELCRQIVAEIPAQYVTQQEKMEYLYDYVCDHVEYVDYESMADESYFYDAVCNGKTVCDGYSNMLSLLFQLIGVECCEAMGSNAENQDGHTWVVAKLDGQFYNFDPTFEDTGDRTAGQRKYFGFSDDLVAVENVVFEEQRPKCTETSRDYAYADLVVSSITDGEAVEKIAELTAQRLANGKNTTTVGVRGIVEESMYNTFFQKFFWYTTSVGEIEISGVFARNSALLIITASPR